MRRVLFVCLNVFLALESSAAADTLFGGAVGLTPPAEPLNFRISYSDIAYLQISPGPATTFFSGDAPNVDAFIVKLTDGVTDDVTLTNFDWTYTVPENYFWSNTSTAAPVFGQIIGGVTPDMVDLYGFTISDVWMRIAPTGYLFQVSGQAPEPSSAMLLIIGLLTTGHRYQRRNVRSSSTS